MENKNLTDAAIAVQDYFSRFRTSFEALEIRPRLNVYTDRVLLAMLGKAFRTSKGVVHLVQESLYSEAFGLSRTCIETFLNLRYLIDTDTEKRCKRYVEYFGKERELGAKALMKYDSIAPSFKFSEDHAELLSMAKQFSSPYNWRLEGKTLKDIAYEPSTWAKNSDGSPEVWEYAYDVIYRLASHEAHATCLALGPDFSRYTTGCNFPPPFDFVFNGTESDGFSALFNSWLFLHGCVIQISHILGLDIPGAIQEAHERLRIRFEVAGF